jgi:hypothetical protein
MSDGEQILNLSHWKTCRWVQRWRGRTQHPSPGPGPSPSTALLALNCRSKPQFAHCEMKGWCCLLVLSICNPKEERLAGIHIDHLAFQAFSSSTEIAAPTMVTVTLLTSSLVHSIQWLRSSNRFPVLLEGLSVCLLELLGPGYSPPLQCIPCHLFSFPQWVTTILAFFVLAPFHSRCLLPSHICPSEHSI